MRKGVKLDNFIYYQRGILLSYKSPNGYTIQITHPPTHI